MFLLSKEDELLGKPDFRKKIGNILANNRKKRGFTLVKAAKYLEVNPFWLKRLEIGYLENITHRETNKIASCYGVNAALLDLAFEAEKRKSDKNLN